MLRISRSVLHRPIGIASSFRPYFARQAASSSQPPAISFDSATEAFGTKTNLELMRSLFVFKLCTIPFLVKNGTNLLIWSNKYLGSAFTTFMLRQTFFGHFCAGVNDEEVQATIKRLKANGIGSILDYAAESDVPGSKVEGVVSARIIPYTGEDQCDYNEKIFKQCIETAAKSSDGFAAIKLTALGDVEVLEHIASTLHKIRRLFRTIGNPDGVKPRRDEPAIHTVQYYLTRKLSWEDFSSGIALLNIRGMDEAQARKLFDGITKNEKGEISYLDWIEFLAPQNMQTRAFFVAGSEPDSGKHSLQPLTKAQEVKLDNMYARLDRLAQQAAAQKVRLMIDAEQTYFQPTIDHVVLQLQRKHNKTFPTIYTTYQCYLTDSYSRVMLDLERAKRHNYIFACKLVRGAYMTSERKRSVDLKYTDPIQKTIEDTHKNYHTVLTEILQHQKDRKVTVMVASHNENTVKYAVQKMQELGIDRSTGVVFFGQLLGMCDHVSFGLGHQGYQVFKYVPYGPVHEVVPYLLRRAEENSSLLGNAAKERKLLWQELVRRRFFFS